MVEGLSHSTFVVSDLERMGRFLEDVFGAKEVYASGEETFSLSREKFFLVGDVWVAIMEGEPLAEGSYNHVAFKIPDAEFDEYVARVRRSGAVMKEPRPRVAGEGRSIYFYDFDNHLFELHTGTLAERLARYGVRADASAEASTSPRG